MTETKEVPAAAAVTEPETKEKVVEKEEKAAPAAVAEDKESKGKLGLLAVQPW